MNRNISKFIFVGSVALLAVIGGTQSGVAFDMKGLGFTAPQVNDKANVVNPQLGDIIFDDSDNTFYGQDNTGAWQALGSGGTSAVPVGTIIAYAGTGTPPGGYVLCDGSSLSTSGMYANLYAAIGTTWGSTGGGFFNLPNAQGVFLRGAGSQTISSISYSATLGVAQGDQFQGHWHNFAWKQAQVGSLGGNIDNVPSTPDQTSTNRVQSPISDGTNGTPRVGSETRPANIGVAYFIKY